MTRPSEHDISFASLTQLRAWLDTGTLSSSDLVNANSRRIAALDRRGPNLHAVIELNADALTLAQEAQHKLSAHAARSVLEGVPVLIKDNIASADAMQTSAGSFALASAPARQDAFVVKQLRQAGAVLLGKTNLSEWANFRSTRSSSGWSARGGLTRNPHVLDRTASGSSSGSAVAVAAGLVCVAVGTETDGSVVSPASANGIVGVKPTVGLVSRAGIVPISHTQDTAGVMARNVRDAALLLQVIAGQDTMDVATQGSPRLDLLAGLSEQALRGKRLGVVRSAFGSHPDVLALMESSLLTLSHAGAVLVDNVDLPSGDSYGDAELQVLLSEFKVDVSSYLQQYAAAGQPRTLAELIAFNRDHASRELAEFGQELFEHAEATGGLSEPIYLEALATCRRLARTEGIELALKQHQLDALIAPTGDPAAPIDLVNGDRSSSSFSTPAAVAGLPHVTVPMGTVRALPVGLSLVGAAYSEAALLGMAYAFEAAAKARVEPTFLPTVALLDPAR